MGVYIDKIQPIEEYLTEESVGYFMQNPNRLFNDPQIQIFICDDQPFRYYAGDGNTRLYVCHKLGIQLIPIPPRFPRTKGQRDSIIDVIEAYGLGVRKWSDFDTRILPEKDVIKYYESKYG